MTPYSTLPLAGAITCVVIALLGIVRGRRSPGDWMLAAGALLLSLDSAISFQISRASNLGDLHDWEEWQLTLLALLPSVWLAFSLTYGRGDVRRHLARNARLLAASFVVPVALVAANFRDLVNLVSGPDNVFALNLNYAGLGIYLAVLVGSVLVLMNLERTFRASVGTMRWRIKFLLFGVGLIFVVRIYTSVQALLFRSVVPAYGSVDSAAVLVGGILVLVSLFRARSTEIEIYPSQAVLQNSLTVLLAGIYLLVVGFFARVVTYFGGDASFALKAFFVLLAMVGLAILLQSDRFRFQMRRFIGRHFSRPIYNYEAAWLTFTEGTASQVDTDTLCRSLAKLTSELFQALSVGIWLLDDNREKLELAASTFATDKSGPPPSVGIAESLEAISRFQKEPSPFALEAEKAGWAVALRDAQPIQFPNYPAKRVCAPIVARGEVYGVIVIGDRVAGAPFTSQDFDMLKCVGAHAAAGILNVQLSRKLLKAKEFEAFQTMATFFVHDMKNAASTLNLMLQNLPLHFNDPQFREDALRGVAKSVDHINHLTGRLSQLRGELRIQATPGDLNELAQAALASIEAGNGLLIEKDLAPLPSFPFDRDQLLKVVSNLLINAREAITGPGRIRISTSCSNGFAALSVADSGIGMTAEFMGKSLFRPFQTTKKNGLGIGMFQSRMIVEAHGGRITVDSTPGQGTQFAIFLPMVRSEV